MRLTHATPSYRVAGACATQRACRPDLSGAVPLASPRQRILRLRSGRVAFLERGRPCRHVRRVVPSCDGTTRRAGEHGGRTTHTKPEVVVVDVVVPVAIRGAHVVLVVVPRPTPRRPLNHPSKVALLGAKGGLGSLRVASAPHHADLPDRLTKPCDSARTSYGRRPTCANNVGPRFARPEVRGAKRFVRVQSAEDRAPERRATEQGRKDNPHETRGSRG